MKNALVFWGALAMTASAMAADVGLGMGVAQNSGTVYVPIEVSPVLRVEPYVSVYKADRDNATYKDVATLITLGAGVFGVQQAGEGVRVFAGARLAYVSRKSDQTTDTYDNHARDTGMDLAPTIGFEYDLNKNLSIGGELGLAYSHLSGKTESNSQAGNTKENTKENSTRTFTTVTIKYHFR